MREILFRGKTYSGKWIYGDLVQNSEDKEVWIISAVGTDKYRNKIVIPETVGQYVGITDKHGKKVYEGDIVAFEIYYKMVCFGVIVYLEEQAMFVVSTKTGFTSFMDYRLDNFEVIGNAHDNPELLR